VGECSSEVGRRTAAEAGRGGRAQRVPEAGLCRSPGAQSSIDCSAVTEAEGLPGDELLESLEGSSVVESLFEGGN